MTNKILKQETRFDKVTIKAIVDTDEQGAECALYLLDNIEPGLFEQVSAHHIYGTGNSRSIGKALFQNKQLSVFWGVKSLIVGDTEKRSATIVLNNPDYVNNLIQKGNKDESFREYLLSHFTISGFNFFIGFKATPNSCPTFDSEVEDSVSNTNKRAVAAPFILLKDKGAFASNRAKIGTGGATRSAVVNYGDSASGSNYGFSVSTTEKAASTLFEVLIQKPTSLKNIFSAQLYSILRNADSKVSFIKELLEYYRPEISTFSEFLPEQLVIRDPDSHLKGIITTLTTLPERLEAKNLESSVPEVVNALMNSASSLVRKHPDSVADYITAALSALHEVTGFTFVVEPTPGRAPLAEAKAASKAPAKPATAPQKRGRKSKASIAAAAAEEAARADASRAEDPAQAAPKEAVARGVNSFLAATKAAAAAEAAKAEAAKAEAAQADASRAADPAKVAPNEAVARGLASYAAAAAAAAVAGSDPAEKPKEARQASDSDQGEEYKKVSARAKVRIEEEALAQDLNTEKMVYYVASDAAVVSPYADYTVFEPFQFHYDAEEEAAYYTWMENGDLASDKAYGDLVEANKLKGSGKAEGGANA